MMAPQGGWIGSPVSGAFTKGPSARTFLPVRGRGSTHDGVEQERGDILGAVAFRSLRAPDRHHERDRGVNPRLRLLLGGVEVAAPVRRSAAPGDAELETRNRMGQTRRDWLSTGGRGTLAAC